MKSEEIEAFVKDYLKERMNSLGIKQNEIRGDFDFVQSGLLDSMAFVDMVSAMEEHFNIEIDFENEVEDSSFTTMKRIVELFSLADDK